MRSLALILILAAGPAAGLSCKAPNFGREFNRIAAVEEVYSVAYGQLREVGPVAEANPGEPRSVRMRFVGKFLGLDGFGETGTVDVVVTTECAGAFCGPLPPTMTPLLAFLEHRDGGLALRAAACPTDTLPMPSLGQVAAVRACMKAGRCGEQELQAFGAD